MQNSRAIENYFMPANRLWRAVSQILTAVMPIATGNRLKS